MTQNKTHHPTHHQNRPGKLIITRWGKKFYKYRTRRQVIPANPLKGTDRRVILHYDEVKPKTRKG